MEPGPKRRGQDSLHDRWLGPEIDEQPSLDCAFDDWNTHASTHNNLSNRSGYRAVRIDDEGNDIRLLDLRPMADGATEGEISGRGDRFCRS